MGRVRENFGGDDDEIGGRGVRKSRQSTRRGRYWRRIGRLRATGRGLGPDKRGDRGRPRTVGRIERGGGDGGEPVRGPPGRPSWGRSRGRPMGGRPHRGGGMSRQRTEYQSRDTFRSLSGIELYLDNTSVGSVNLWSSGNSASGTVSSSNRYCKAIFTLRDGLVQTVKYPGLKGGLLTKGAVRFHPAALCMLKGNSLPLWPPVRTRIDQR